MDFILENFWLSHGILLFTGIFCGFINVVSGGGSLLSLPVLIFIGLPPTEANATNRIAILTQSVTANLGFVSKSVHSFPLGLYQGLLAGLGSILGTIIAVYINPDSFKDILVVIIVVVVCLIVYKPKSEFVVFKNKKIRNATSLFLYFLIGIYGGFIQAALGFLAMLVSTAIDRMTIHQANQAKVFATLCITIVALAIFIYYDLVNWELGISLAIGGAIGGWLASRWSVKQSTKLINIIVVITALVMAAYLILSK